MSLAVISFAIGVNFRRVKLDAWWKRDATSHLGVGPMDKKHNKEHEKDYTADHNNRID